MIDRRKGLCYDTDMDTNLEQVTGLVFDIEEFAVFDGPGIRCAVFVKGCPLHCMWCHNPEGLAPHPQRVVTLSLCEHCGACREVCPSKERYIGVDNALILQNLEQLKGMNKLFRIRVPLIPTVNDTMENMEATARLLEGAQMLEKVELLRYNKAAGAKYGGVGLTYAPDFPEQQEPNIFREPFERRGIRVDIL